MKSMMKVLAEMKNEQKSYTVQLELQLGPLWGQSPVPDDCAIEKIELDPSSQRVVEDGDYRLEYSFNGRKERTQIRVLNGMLLSRG